MFRPTSKAARKALKALRRPLLPGATFSQELAWRSLPEYDQDALRETLLAVTCPMVCDGVVREDRPERWHDLCEGRVDLALRALAGTL